MMPHLRSWCTTALTHLEAGCETPQVRRMLRALIGTVVFLFPFSLAAMSSSLFPSSLSWIASISIALYAALTLISEVRQGSAGRTSAVFIGITVLVFFAEWSGVHTDVPFGAYEYTDALGWRVDGVPVAIMLAWYALVVSAWRMSRLLACQFPSSVRRIAIAALTGLHLIILDIVLEVVAVFIKGYWHWDAGVIPLSNYLSWFSLSAAVAYALEAIHATPPAGVTPADLGRLRTSLLIYLLQLTLFVWIAALHGYIMIAAGAFLFMIASGTMIDIRFRQGRMQAPMTLQDQRT